MANIPVVANGVPIPLPFFSGLFPGGYHTPFIVVPDAAAVAAPRPTILSAEGPVEVDVKEEACGVNTAADGEKAAACGEKGAAWKLQEWTRGCGWCLCGI